MANGNFTIVLDEKEYNELMRRLSGLADVDKRTAIGNALKKGITIIQNQGKANLSATHLHTNAGKKGEGKLRGSFAIKLDRKKSISYAGFKRPQGAAAHLVDKGTAPRYTKKGAYRGTVQKRGPYTGSLFWSKAVESQSMNAVDTLMDAVYDEVEKIMNKGRR